MDDFKTLPCVGCGYCCTKGICEMGAIIYGTESAPCPGLYWNNQDRRHFCRLVLLGNDIRKFFKDALYIGAGCCSSMFNTWRVELKDRTNTVRRDQHMSPVPLLMQVFIRCLSENLDDKILEDTLSNFKHILVKNYFFDIESAELFTQWVKKHFTE